MIVVPYDQADARGEGRGGVNAKHTKAEVATKQARPRMNNALHDVIRASQKRRLATIGGRIHLGYLEYRSEVSIDTIKLLRI